MFLIYPSIILPPPDKTFSGIKTLVGMEHQLAQWPSAILEPGACNELLTTLQIILENNTGSRIIPLTEKVVLASALASAKLGLKESLGLDAAINGSDRLKQRLTLEPTGLNPRWFVDQIGDLKFPLIMKKPTSARSRGVKFVTNPEEIKKFLENGPGAGEERLQISGYPPTYKFVAEEFIEGESWEVNGICRKKTIHIFPPLKQIWSAPAEKITEYRQEKPPAGLVDSAIKAVEACGLKWCTWCVELKGYENRWKVVEVNSRLGEDGRGYYKLLGGSNIANKICELLA